VLHSNALLLPINDIPRHDLPAHVSHILEQASSSFHR
jgi:hypothetical protein